MTIKDSLDTAGVITTAGTLGRKSFVPKSDATVVARLKQAGAILLGKTNTPEFTLDFKTDNLVFGRTNNPYDTDLSPGGSSGGPAAAVACGASPFDIGSDTAGSIRLPSHYCGITGIKPTAGRVPLTGHAISYGCGLAGTSTQVGPLARRVEDLATVLPIMAGPDNSDPSVIPMPWCSPTSIQLSGLRAALYVDNEFAPASSDVSRVVREAGASLANAGLSVNEDRPQGIGRSVLLYLRISMADGGEWVKRLLREAGTKRISLTDKPNRKGISGKEFGQLIAEVHQLRIQLHSFLQNYDVILCPVSARATMSHDNDEIFTGSYTCQCNLTGWPSAVVRCGSTDQGMPIGVQIIAGPWREDICLAVAKFLETELGGWQPPPL